MVISIPYSNDQSTYIKLKDKYKIINPTIEELSNHGFLKKVLYESIVSSRSVVILEIGGFFAKVAEDISLKLGDRLLGIVEDIEHGHRQYEKYIQKIACPVVSVARSELKEAEDFLVGTSCLYSTEKMIRRLGFPIVFISSSFFLVSINISFSPCLFLIIWAEDSLPFYLP